MGKVKQMALEQEEAYIQKTIEEGGDSQQEILNNIYKRNIIFHSQDQIEEIIFDYFNDEGGEWWNLEISLINQIALIIK